MATDPRPTDIPRWADTGAITVPSDTKQDAGWVSPELPPAEYFNWHQNLVGQWMKWIDQYLFQGSTINDFKIEASSTTGAGGDLELLAATPAAGGNDGGDATLQAGFANGAGDGGGVFVTGGDADTGGEGGDVTIQAGEGAAGDPSGTSSLIGGPTDTDGEAGLAFVVGGQGVGTDISAGNAVVKSGPSTGNKGGSVLIQAAVAGGSGVTTRTPETFIECKGLTNEILVSKTIDVTADTSQVGIIANAVTGQAAINVVCVDSTPGLDIDGADSAFAVDVASGDTGGIYVESEAASGTGFKGISVLIDGDGTAVFATRQNPVGTPGPLISSVAAGGGLLRVEETGTSVTESASVFIGDTASPGAPVIEVTAPGTRTTPAIKLNTTFGAPVIGNVSGPASYPLIELLAGDNLTIPALRIVSEDASSIGPAAIFDQSTNTSVSSVSCVKILGSSGSGGEALRITRSGGGLGIFIDTQGTCVGGQNTDGSSGLACFLADATGSIGPGLSCQPNTTRGAINLGSISGNPSSPSEADFWYDTTANVLKYYDGSSVKTVTAT
jgi:hypothetical protein